MHSFNNSTTFKAIAGHEANPGDWMPATFIRFLLALECSIIKSPVLLTALRPEYCLIKLAYGIFSIIRDAWLLTLSRISLVVDKSCLSSTKSLDGPIR